MASKPTAGRRKRASSVKEVIDNIEYVFPVVCSVVNVSNVAASNRTDPAHHLAGPFANAPPTYVARPIALATLLA